MDIERVNGVLERAIVGLQSEEIDNMVEAMASGVTSYEVPSPKGVAFGRTGAYKIPSAPPLRKLRKGGKPQKRAPAHLTKTKKKQLIVKIYKELPKSDKMTAVPHGDWGHGPGFRRAKLKSGGRHVIVWRGPLATGMGRKYNTHEFLDELADVELRMLADALGIVVTKSKIRKPPKGIKFVSSNMGPQVVQYLSGEKLLEVLKYIRDARMSAVINHSVIDMTSADLIVKLAEKYTSSERKRFLSMPVDEIGMYAWGHFSKRGEVKVKR